MFSSDLSCNKTRQMTQVSSLPFRILFACPAAEVNCALKAGAGAKATDTAFLFLVYSTAEY